MVKRGASRECFTVTFPAISIFGRAKSLYRVFHFELVGSTWWNPFHLSLSLSVCLAYVAPVAESRASLHIYAPAVRRKHFYEVQGFFSIILRELLERELECVFHTIECLATPLFCLAPCGAL